MLVKKGKKIKEFLAGDHSILKELLHPEKDGIELGYSIVMVGAILVPQHSSID